MNQIKTILFGHFLGFFQSIALLSMAANAVISTAPAQLPAWREFPQWAWTWIVQSARQFWSLQHPQASSSTTNPNQQEKDNDKK